MPEVSLRREQNERVDSPNAPIFPSSGCPDAISVSLDQSCFLKTIPSFLTIIERHLVVRRSGNASDG